MDWRTVVIAFIVWRASDAFVLVWVKRVLLVWPIRSTPVKSWPPFWDCIEHRACFIVTCFRPPFIITILLMNTPMLPYERASLRTMSCWSCMSSLVLCWDSSLVDLVKSYITLHLGDLSLLLSTHFIPFTASMTWEDSTETLIASVCDFFPSLLMYWIFRKRRSRFTFLLIPLRMSCSMDARVPFRSTELVLPRRKPMLLIIRA